MKTRILLGLLPFLVAGQNAVATWEYYCDHGKPQTGTIDHEGVLYDFTCNVRAETYGTGEPNSSPGECARLMAGNVGAIWIGDYCYPGKPGQLVPHDKAIYLKRSASQNQPLTQCQAALSTCNTQLATCNTQLTSCNTGNTGNPSTPPITTQPTCGNTHTQAGSQWTISCNTVHPDGASIINPSHTASNMRECIDKCAAATGCKVALLTTQSKNNCVLYRRTGGAFTQAGAMMAVKP